MYWLNWDLNSGNCVPWSLGSCNGAWWFTISSGTTPETFGNGEGGSWPIAVTGDHCHLGGAGKVNIV